MPRKKLQKILPTHDKIKEQKMLKIFGNLLYKKELWSLSRKKILIGIFIGVFVAFIPMPFQMILSCLLALLLSANLPISLVLVWLSNPLTMPFMFYGAYEFGLLVLNKPRTIEFTMESMNNNFDTIATALYTGSLVLGLICAIFSVILVNLLWIRTVRKKRKNSLA